MMHKNHFGLSKKDAVYKYIEVASKTPLFGMSFFLVENEFGEYRPFSIAEDGLFFFDLEAPVSISMQLNYLPKETILSVVELDHKLEYFPKCKG